MGRWACPLTTAVFTLPLLSSPPLTVFSLLCCEDLLFVSFWFIFPCCLPAFSVPRSLHFLLEMFISLFFFASSGFPVPSWPETFIFYSSEYGVFSASSLGLGDHYFLFLLCPEASPSFFFKSENLHSQSLVFCGSHCPPPFWAGKPSPSLLSGFKSLISCCLCIRKPPLPALSEPRNPHCCLLFWAWEPLSSSRPGFLYFLFYIHPLLPLPSIAQLRVAGL